MFQVPAKTQYAIRALAHLARTGGDSAARIAASQAISPKYLEGILGQLKMAGIVLSGRGRSGGYRLARDAYSIRMSEIVKATEGDVLPVRCVSEENACSNEALCMPRRFWVGLKEAVDGYLESVTLGEIAEDPKSPICDSKENP